MLARFGGTVELRASYPDFLRVRKVAAKHANTGVHDLCLEILDRRVEDAEVCGNAGEWSGLQTKFIVMHVLGFHSCSRKDRVTQRIRGDATQVETHGFESSSESAVGIDC